MTYGKCEICEVKTETKDGNKNDFHGKISHKLKLVKICKENIKKRSWAEDNYDDKLRKKIQRTVIKCLQQDIQIKFSYRDMFNTSKLLSENVANCDVIPSIYVNNLVLDSLPYKGSGYCFSVNGATFSGDIRIENRILEFELYQKVTKRKNKNMEAESFMHRYNSSDSESENEEISSAPLPISVQKLPYNGGVLINSIIFLPSQHWHTLLAVDVRTLTCVLCDAFCEVGARTRHMESDSHILQMSLHKPLERFDLSITRKVRDIYHCGVCNESFSEQAVTEHFSSKMHEGKLLFAINKASDIIYNEDTERNNNVEKSDCVHFDTNNIIEEHNTGYGDYDFAPDNYEFIDYKQNDFVEYDDDDEYYGEFASEQFTGTSYATIAKKPIIDQKKFLDIDLGNKTVKVRYNSWHMIISPQQSRYYCMVCKKFDHIRLKTDHCQDEGHLKKLAACRVVNTFQDHFIRRVDDKLYHCGHCNNLQLVHLMQHHIDKVHPKKEKPIEKNEQSPSGSDSSICRKIEEILLEQSNAANLNGQNRKVKETNGAITLHDTFKRIDNFDMMVIHPFGYELIISRLAYHMVCKRVKNFYCCLCDTVFEEDEVTRHMRQPGHQQTLHRTPFIRPFSCNLIRAIREALHCAVCNMPVSADTIYNHLVDPIHVFMLKKILGETDGDSTKLKRSPSQASVASSDSPKTETPIKKGLVKKELFTKEPLKIESKSKTKEVTNHNNVKKEPHLVIKDINYDVSVTKTPVKNKLMERLRKDSEDSINNYNYDNKSMTDTHSPKINYEEFNMVPYRKHSKEETEDLDLESTFESNDELMFDSEEYVYLKLKNTYIKISNSAYNTLVFVGDGSRYCFVCSVQVHYDDVAKHVDSRSHLENIEKYLFLDKYEDHLLRQIYLNYHCSICNVIVTRKELKSHFDWPTHALQIENTQRNIKKARKTEIKGGVKQIIISTQKENIYLNEKDSHIKIHYHVTVVAKRKANIEIDLNEDVTEPLMNDFKKNKIIIFNDNVLKLSWENWHGIARIKNGFKCNLCQRELKKCEIETHCNSEWHRYALDKPYEKQYAPALIRKVNESTLNCLICNTEVSNKEHLVAEHIKGKRHKSNHEIIVKESSTTNTYTDCIGDVLML